MLVPRPENPEGTTISALVLCMEAKQEKEERQENKTERQEEKNTKKTWRQETMMT